MALSLMAVCLETCCGLEWACLSSCPHARQLRRAVVARRQWQPAMANGIVMSRHDDTRIPIQQGEALAFLVP